MGWRPPGDAIDVPLPAFGESAAGKTCALSRRDFAGHYDRPPTVTRTSAHQGSPQL